MSARPCCPERTSRSTAAGPGRCTRSSPTRPTRPPVTRRVAFDAARPRLLRHARLPVRRADQCPQPGRPGLQLGRRRQDLGTVRVASGSGNFGSVGDLLDKEYIAAWGDGNAIVTYGDFRLGQKGSSSRPGSTLGHPRRRPTWSTPQVISGSLDRGVRLDAGRRGRRKVYVSFLNTTDLDDRPRRLRGRRGRSRDRRPLSPSRSRSRPRSTAPPTTRSPSAARRIRTASSAPGPPATSPPTRPTPHHLAVVWSDMRNSPTPAPADPYVADQLGRRRQPVVRRRPHLVGSGRARARRRPVPCPGVRTTPRPPADRHVRPPIRLGQPPLRLLAGHGDGTGLADVLDHGGLTTVLSDPTTGNRWFAATLKPGLPVRHDVPRRLQQHRGHARRQRRRHATGPTCARR